MPNKKWALEEPLTFELAQELYARANPKVGASLGWGGLKLHGRAPGVPGPEFYLVKKGCVVLMGIYEDRALLLPGSWRSDLALKFLSVNSPLPLREHGRDWYLLRPGTKKVPVLFVDGMVVGKDFIEPCISWTPASGASPAEAAKTFFMEYVDYVCNHVNSHKVEHPSAEGCWECYFHTTEIIEGSRLPRASEPSGVCHLFQHAIRKEIEPSLIWRAVKEDGLKPGHHWDKLMGTSKLHPEAHLTVLRDHLWSFFRRRLGQLGAYQLWATSREDHTDDSRPGEDDPCRVGSAAS